MTPERFKLASAKFGSWASARGVMLDAHYDVARDAYLRGFGDGVETILETSGGLAALEQSLRLKDIRLDILETENRRLKEKLEHRKNLHEIIQAELKIVLDRITMIVGLRDPSLIKSMEEIRRRLL